MHVAHVLRKLDPAAWGGVETHVHALAAALRARDVGGTLFAPRRGPEDEAPGGAPVERYRALLPVLGPAERRRALWAVGVVTEIGLLLSSGTMTISLLDNEISGTIPTQIGNIVADKSHSTRAAGPR